MVRRQWAKLLSPVIYAGLHAFVFIALMYLVAAIESRIGLHAVYRTGDVELALGILTIGTPIFMWGAIRLYELELDSSPGLADHLRHCALLYLVVLAAAVWLPLNYSQHGRGLYYGLVATGAAVAALAIVVNALVLLRFRRRGAATAPTDQPVAETGA